MEFRFNVNEIFKYPVVEINSSLIPPGLSLADKRALWDAVGKVSDVVNAMGEASATAQGLTKPITTSERLRNSEHKLYLLLDQNANNGKGVVTGMLKTGKKGLYVFDRDGHHYQVQPACVLDFYVHESKQRMGLGKRLFEHMLEKEQVEPIKMAIDRPSDKFLGFLNKHYGLDSPVKQMNNFVVFDGFFPETKDDLAENNNTPLGKSNQPANGLQSNYSSPYGRYGAPRPPCSMGQIIHNQSSLVQQSQEPAGWNNLNSNKVKDIPPVPIQTYKWEDVRRVKRKGRYPYTHITKGPYNIEIDPSEFKMDTLRPSKSASTLEKSSSGVDIQDVTDKSTNHSKDYLDVSAANEGIIEMADSSNEDNISQYLDKDDDRSFTIEQIEVPGPSKEQEKMEVDEGVQDQERAKSEEPKRKRKLSIESSYSRISLSKLGVMKKLREAKEKLKLPKFSFSKSESKLDIPKKSKKDKDKKSDNEKPKKSLQAYIESSKKKETPVYIHIPLKPPPGQTDEFSYLEFENGKSPSTSKLSSPTEEKPELGESDEDVLDEKGKEGVQFIILTAPSDDEVLDDHATLPDSPSSNGSKKFFDAAKLKDLKHLAKECVDEIPPGTPIDGIIFEDVIQVEYVDEHNNPIGTTERSNFLEITEENLPKIEKQLSKRNLMKELQHELASSMDAINKINRRNTLKRLKEQHRSRSNEGLPYIESNIERKTQEAPELTTPVINVTKNIEDNKEESEKIKTEPETEEKKEVPKPTESESQKEDSKKVAMYDEEDGLKLSATAVQMINEELAKEQLPMTNEEQLKAAAKSASVKKKVSFKRRSKQEDPHGIYEDVRVTSDGKTVDGKEQQVKELKVIDPSQSMSVDEEKSYLDDKIIKAKSLEEDYNKWSKLNDHEYEPINPPAENEKQQQLPSLEVKITDNLAEPTTSKWAFLKTQAKISPPNSVRIPLRDEVIVKGDEEAETEEVLTAEEMQTRIEDQFLNNESSSTQPRPMPPAMIRRAPDISSTANSKENEPQESQAKKIQEAFKNQAGKLRTKLKSIKKPNIQMPQRPNLERFKIQKPNINLPKIPDTMRVNLPSFTLPKRSSSSIQKRTVKQYSTESNVGDSKKKLFDFSTYPRIFRKKKQKDDLDDDGLDVSATVPRAKKSPKFRVKAFGKSKESAKRSPDVVRIPLHSEASMDKDEGNLSSRNRYEEENIDVDDDYLRESQQMNIASSLATSDFSRNRWNHGSFHGHNLNEIENVETEVKVTDLDNDVDRAQTSPEPEIEQEVVPDSRQSDMLSVSSSGDVHRPGVLEKINSDEYFMQMGNYLSTEIREAFQQPTNPLAKLQNDDSFDREFDISDHSIQEAPKRRPIKKPKRKKTPNVSKERIPAYDQESEPEEEYPKPFDEQPARPKRKSKNKRRTKDEKPPYQETIFVQEPEFEIMRKAASDNILSSDRFTDNFHNGHFKQEYVQHYENEKMQGIEQPNIFISDPYHKEEIHYMEDDDDDDDDVNINGYDRNVPEAPPRKQRSLKSLVSETDSIVNEINLANQNLPHQNIQAYRMEHEYIIPTPEEPPIRPSRTRSRTRSQSRATSQPEDEAFQITEPELPCVEEPCVQQTCDYMGYAVIDKNKNREPPLPPPTRRKKSNNSSAKSEAKFFTVPRPLKEDVPVRPLRNYSTLVPKSQRSTSNLGEEGKENLDLGQYIEIEDEDGHSRLQSGDVVQKMKDRPLPAPPRPPRKTKDSDRDIPFTDITHKTNVDEEEPLEEKIEESEVSVQTEPLPDDFVCEELVQEKGDKIITPTTSKLHPPITEFENIETVTHGALIVTPVASDFQEGPITQFSRSTEKIITIRREIDHEDDTSDVPESFQALKDPQPRIIERIIERPAQPNPEVEVLKAQKLQVSDLDVDRLMVNELLASKIKVSEIDGESISVAEINPKSGRLVIGGLELPINFIQDILDKLTKAHSSTADQPPQQASDSQAENISKNMIPSKDENVIYSSDQEGDSVPLKQDNEQLQLKQEMLSFNEDQITSKVKVPSIEEDQQLPDKLEATTLPSEDRDDLEKDSCKSKSKLPDEDSELSPNTLKTTIEYLDDLITEENIKLDLVENDENVLRKDLESAVESKIAPTVEAMSTPKQISIEEKSESIDLEEIPPLMPDTSEEERLIEELISSSSEQKKTPFEKLNEPPRRPPRQSDGNKFQQLQDEIFIPSQIIENSHNLLLGESTPPPPRPPDPEEVLYLRSQPPPSFYVLRSPALDGFIDDDIPMPPRRKRPPRPPSRSSSEETPPAAPRTRRHRTPEPTIPQLTGQLTKACATAGEKAFKRLLKHITMNVLRNADGKQDLHVMILILLILVAGLILLGNGGNPIVHHYHWEYFNPPKDL